MEVEMLPNVSELIGRAKLRSPEELRSWPKVQTVESGVQGVQITMFHDLLPMDKHLIAIQVLRNCLGGISTEIKVEGFVLAPDGTIEVVPDELLWQFQ
jgi:hypothetical protein